LKTSDLAKTICRSYQDWKFPHVVPVIGIAVLLLSTFRLYWGVYFSRDDFNNLALVQQETFGGMLGHILNPVSSHFRPVGMMCYWLLLQFFGLNPAAYHCLVWSLHAANTALVYFVLKQLTASRAGAAVGAMLFASQFVFEAIYLDVGNIFDPVAALFSLVGILVWISERRRWSHVLIASLALFLAVKGKEMALTMPIIWVSYDLLVRKNMNKRMIAQWVIPSGLALCYGVTKIVTGSAMVQGMQEVLPSHPYYMSVGGSVLAQGFGEYFNMLLRTNFPWQVWCLWSVVLLLVFVLLRNRLGLFFQLYVFLAFLPVIFLVNHRFAHYWYLPFLGVCGFAAMLAKSVTGLIETRNPKWVAKSGATAVFLLLCWSNFLLHKNTMKGYIALERQRADEHRAFVTGLRSLPPPAQGETIFFDSCPSLFDGHVLRSATRIAFGRGDLSAKLVTEFPAEARYRLRFVKSHVTQVPP
jgi:hypothetical protein